jgi:CRP-like cAMP-binding protein
MVLVGNERVRTISRLDYFGERALIFDTPRSASIVAVGPAICWEFSKDDVLSAFDSNTREQLLARIELQDDTVKFSDL